MGTCVYSVLTAKGLSCTQDVYVVAGLTKTLLVLPAIESLSFVHRIEAVAQQNTQDFVAACPSVFSGLGLLQEPYHIELEKEAFNTPQSASTSER